MPFINETNTNRVAKMCDTIVLLNKSANSNKASQAQIDELFAPLLDRLEEAGALGEPVEPGPEEYDDGPDDGPEPADDDEDAYQTTGSGQAGTEPRKDLQLLDMIRNCPVEELPGALSVMATRLDKEMFED